MNMRSLRPGSVLLLFILLLGCGPKPSDPSSGNAEQGTVTEDQLQPTVPEKYLITDNSVGYFPIGGAWQDAATRQYGFKFIQGYGTCEDACCDGGYDLGFRIEDGDYGKEMADLQITIGAVLFSESESADEFRYSPGVFFSSSPNCTGWYWMDKINYILVSSSRFRTKEDVGVGSTLPMMQERFGRLDFNVGWIEEDPNALQVSVPAYPNIRFILNVEDYQGNWQDIDMKGEKNGLTIADFKRGTKIRQLLVYPARASE